MKARSFLLVAGALLLAALLVRPAPPGAAQGEDPYTLDWWTVDGGGSAILGGDYTLVATTGQPDAGTLSGGLYTLAGGFWAVDVVASPTGAVFLPVVLKVADAGVAVEDVPNILITSEDPILQTGYLDPAVLAQAPDPPPDRIDKGAPALIDEMTWAPLAQLTLNPGDSHAVTVSFDEPVVLLAEAQWLGTVAPLELQVTMDGATLATGQPFPVPPNQGVVAAQVEIDDAGSATVTVLNPTGSTADVEILVSTLPLSFQDTPLRGGGE